MIVTMKTELQYKFTCMNRSKHAVSSSVIVLCIHGIWVKKDTTVVAFEFQTMYILQFCVYFAYISVIPEMTAGHNSHI